MMDLTPRRHHKRKPKKPLQGVALDLCIRINPQGEYILTDISAKGLDGRPHPVSEWFSTRRDVLDCIETNLEKIAPN